LKERTRVPEEPPKNHRDFMLIIKIGVALSLALMAAFLLSLKQVHPTIVMRLDWISIAGCLITGIVSWRFCTILQKSDESADPGRRRFMIRWMKGFLGAASLGTVAAFAYALKDVSGPSRLEVIEGTAIAVVVLAIGGWLIYRAFRFFEEQSALELEQQERDRQERERDGDPPPD
jgi:hypothetical protein